MLMEISNGNFIQILDLTRSSCEKCNYIALSQEENLYSRAIPVQRSKQLSYRAASC
jgi:hypothetical protein